MAKSVYTLNIGNFAPDVCARTYPFIQHWATKIGAEFRIITERKFPDWPVVYEKLQIHELGRDADWNIFVDSDTLIHPDCPDYTALIPMDTVAHNGKDMNAVRWTMDDYFLRDGRHIGSCNWFAIASHWCLDLWRPLDDLTLDQAVARISPTLRERIGEVEASHLIDDYVCSRNIARFGLKFTTITELNRQLGFQGGFFWHQYNMGPQQKLHELKKAMLAWELE